ALGPKNHEHRLPSFAARLLVVVLVVVLAGAGCGDDDADEAASSGPTPTAVAGGSTPATASPSGPTVTPAPTSAAGTPDTGCLAELPERMRLGQLLMAMVVPADYPLVVQAAEDHSVGAVALLGAPTQADMSVLSEAGPAGGALPLTVASDEEGGTVQRLANVFGPLPTAEALAASLPPDEVEAMFAAYGAQLTSVGVGMALAPVVDVGSGPGIASRSFSSDPDVVVEYGAAVIAGYQQAGLTPVIKHFPGHGGASADTHDVLAQTAPIDELRARDLVPFEALATDGVAVMVGHLVVPGLTDGLPASLSPAAIDGLLRGELGFDGLVLTDALNMGALTSRWSTAEAVELSLLAGADVAIIDSLTVVPAVIDRLQDALASGRLTEERIDRSVQRVFAAKGLDACVVASELGVSD
ncbi:MAG: hypothetical protein KDB21_08015, partial [Acidimicrobiales bacterium]|nr:hypothetical protein [Acidimicrobiales bacterium]